MNVQGLVVVRVKLKDKTQEYKYSWNGFFFAKIGNDLITSKSFLQFVMFFVLCREAKPFIVPCCIFVTKTRYFVIFLQESYTEEVIFFYVTL